MYICLYIWTLYIYMYTIRHVNMQHNHEIFTELIFLTRRRYGIVETSYFGHAS